MTRQPSCRRREHIVREGRRQRGQAGLVGERVQGRLQAPGPAVAIMGGDAAGYVTVRGRVDQDALAVKKLMVLFCRNFNAEMCLLLQVFCISELSVSIKLKALLP